MAVCGGGGGGDDGGDGVDGTDSERARFAELIKFSKLKSKSKMADMMVCSESVETARPECRDGKCASCGFARLWSQGARKQVYPPPSPPPPFPARERSGSAVGGGLQKAR